METDILSTVLSDRCILSVHPGLNFCKSHTCNSLFNADLSLDHGKFHEDGIALSLGREALDSLQCREFWEQVVRKPSFGLLNGKMFLFPMTVMAVTLEEFP